jgi:hypothetical protein
MKRWRSASLAVVVAALAFAPAAGAHSDDVYWNEAGGVEDMRFIFDNWSRNAPIASGLLPVAMPGCGSLVASPWALPGPRSEATCAAAARAGT